MELIVLAGEGKPDRYITHRLAMYAMKESKVRNIKRVCACVCTHTQTNIWYIRESLSGTVAFEQKPERSERGSHLSISG